MANGHDFNPDQLHREGCTFGQLLANEVSHLKEDTSEIKADLKEVKSMVTSLTTYNAQQLAEKVGSVSEKIAEAKGSSEWPNKILGYALQALVAAAVAFGVTRAH